MQAQNDIKDYRLNFKGLRQEAKSVWKTYIQISKFPPFLHITTDRNFMKLAF